MPEWVVRRTDDDHYIEMRVTAYSREDAAVMAVEKWEYSAAEFPIASGHDYAIVEVLDEHLNTTKRYRVDGDPHPVYRVCEAPEIQSLPPVARS